MEGDHFDDPDLDGRIILKWIFKKCCGGQDWIDLALRMGTRVRVLNVVMNVRVS
jgi:hypothetical protein